MRIVALQVPELEEAFNIRLVNATGGASITTSGSQVATISVRASDHPYGLFAFSSAFRPLRVSESVGEAEVMVTREFGDMGRVTIDYATVESGHSSLEGVVDVMQLEAARWVTAYVWLLHMCAHFLAIFLQLNRWT